MRSESLIWLNFGKVSRGVVLLYENDIFLLEVTANGFPAMTAGQICTEDVINNVIIVTDVENVVD